MLEPVLPPIHLPISEGKLFYELYSALCSHANRSLKIVPGEFSDSKRFTALPPDARVKVRDGLLARPELIDQFIEENPSRRPADELAIVAGWKHAVSGHFYVLRYLKQYAVFLSEGNPPKAYGVLALASPFEELLGTRLPARVQCVLLPINGRIIYDGLMTVSRVQFGPGIRRSLNEELAKAKSMFGVIRSLPEGSTPPAPRRLSPAKESVAKPRAADVKPILAAIVEMTDAFCGNHLNDEYAGLCRDMAATLARKRPSPLLRGRLEAWACGIVRAVGWVNFLDDSTRKPHLELPFIDQAFGVAESTGQGKSRLIREMLRIRTFDPKWTLPSGMADNPRIWLLSVNGIIIDIRRAPRELQVDAFEQGLIPYIPADRG